MKKVLSLLLTLALLGTSFTAFSLDTANVNAEDVKPLYFNDFENCTFPGTSYFSIADTGDAEYGKAMRASFINPNEPNKAYAAVTGSQSSTGNYVRDGVTYKTFNEALTPNTDYILAFTYKVTDKESLYGSALGVLSFAPQIPGSIFEKNSDYKYYLDMVDGWTQTAVMFNSNEATKMNVKINTQASNVTTWVDNYGVYEPVALTVKGMDVSLQITNGVYTNGYLGKGSSLCASAPKGMFITSVKMNGEDVALDNGKINIPVVTGPVEVFISSSLEGLNNYYVNGEKILLTKGYPMAEFLSTALTNETYTLTNSQGVPKAKDGVLNPGDKLSIKVNSAETKEFKIACYGDGSGKPNYNVTDIINAIERIVNDVEFQPEYELNGSGRLTVSDVVDLRKKILNTEIYSINEERLAAEKAKISADAAEYGITAQMLAESVTNVGNRSRVANVMKKALRGENITIATIGGSITEGTGITIADGRAEKCWAALMADWWKRMFPGQVTFVNAGISGTNSNFGIYRLESDVLVHDPDLLFVEFAANDGEAKGSIRSCQEAIILKMLERGDAAIQMFFTTVGYNGGGGQVTYQPLGEYYDIPQISPRDAFWGEEFHAADGKVYSHFKDTEGTGLSIANDGTHPNIRGNAMVAVLTNNYLNSVYENLADISTQSNAIPKETFEDDTPNYMHLTDFDAGLTTEADLYAGGKVNLTSYGCFSKCTDSVTFRCHNDPMYGVKYISGNISPMVIEIDDCHVFGIVNQVSYTGYSFTVAVYEQGTDTLILSRELSSQHSSESMARNHAAVFESVEGKDITVKITPVADSGDTLTIRNIYVS